MRRFLLASVVLVAFASSASGQSLGGGSLGGGSLGEGALGAGAIGGGRGSEAPGTLPAAPQYYIAASVDFADQAIADGESIGATHDVCPSSDSVTTTCLGQALVVNRPTWQRAADCRGGVACWKFDANDFFGGTGSTLGLPGDWAWLAGGPTICHSGQSYDATVSGVLAGLFGNKTTSSASKGLYLFSDTRTAKRDILIEVGSSTNTGLTGASCLLGLDETTPFLVTYELLGLGAGEMKVYVNGTSCGTTTAAAYVDVATTIRFAVPYINGSVVEPMEGNFVWCDTSTSAGSVAAMQTRGAAAQAVLAAQLGVTLP